MSGIHPAQQVSITREVTTLQWQQGICHHFPKQQSTPGSSGGQSTRRVSGTTLLTSSIPLHRPRQLLAQHHSFHSGWGLFRSSISLTRPHNGPGIFTLIDKYKSEWAPRFPWGVNVASRMSVLRELRMCFF